MTFLIFNRSFSFPDGYVPGTINIKITSAYIFTLLFSEVIYTERLKIPKTILRISVSVSFLQKPIKF